MTYMKLHKHRQFFLGFLAIVLTCLALTMLYVPTTWAESSKTTNIK